MKIITSHQQKEQKKQGNDISKLPAGSVHENNRQERNRHALFTSARKIVQQSQGDRQFAIKDIEMVATFTEVNANPRKLWRRFAKDFI
jgi:hypothetical protein